jgi:flagellar L-ring protein precursor FlgH
MGYRIFETTERRPWAAWLAALVAAAAAWPAGAQNSSLFHRDLPVHQQAATTLANGSWMYRPLPPPKEVRIHDIITIRVDEKSQTFAEGDMDRRKSELFDAVLKDWVVLEGLKQLKPAPMRDGDPRVQGQLSQLYRAESELETRESVKFDIAAEVVDIRPNGNLVLEAHRNIRNNEENWEYSLTGICRREDIGPNNTLLSKNIAELTVVKRERGHVRDSYRRGWLLRLWDTFHLF